MTQKSKNSRGRPKIEVNIEQAKKLCQMACTRDEICDVLGIDDETLCARLKEQGYENFSTFYKKHSVDVKVSLRRYQLQAAAQLQPAILIWLGKQYLGQRDQEKEPRVVIKEVETKSLFAGLDAEGLRQVHEVIQRYQKEENHE